MVAWLWDKEDPQLKKANRARAGGEVCCGDSEQWARSIELWQKRLAPRLPDISPDDLALILGSILQPEDVPRRFLLRRG